MAFSARKIPGAGSNTTHFYEAVGYNGEPVDRIVKASVYEQLSGSDYVLENPTHLIIITNPFGRDALAAYAQAESMPVSEDEDAPENTARERALARIEELYMREEAAHEFSRPMAPDALAEVCKTLSQLALNSNAPTIAYTAQ